MEKNISLKKVIPNTFLLIGLTVLGTLLLSRIMEHTVAYEKLLYAVPLMAIGIISLISFLNRVNQNSDEMLLIIGFAALSFWLISSGIIPTSYPFANASKSHQIAIIGESTDTFAIWIKEREEAQIGTNLRYDEVGIVDPIFKGWMLLDKPDGSFIAFNPLNVVKIEIMQSK